MKQHNYTMECLTNNETQAQFQTFSEKISKFYIFMIVLHIVLLVVIIFSFVKHRATLKGRWFNLLIMGLLGFLQLGAVVAEIRYITGHFNECLEFYLISIGFSNMILLLCSLLLCYKYFATAAQIYEVSKYHKLTTKLKEKI